jgi:hypothetical protein
MKELGITLVLCTKEDTPRGSKCPICGDWGKDSMTGPGGIEIIFCSCVGPGCWGISGGTHV